MNTETKNWITLNKEPDHIWGMVDGNGTFGLRFDCGDSGYIPLTREQAQEVIDTLQQLLGEL